ncbi:hypothetical protein HDE_09059 [Halotydeus destructor]|nr:hypothetical protein HDE_09059 [Halotydeus destructor]
MQLTDCIATCARLTDCLSVNFETGLCILFNSSAPYDDKATGTRNGLRVAQFPVFTIYAEKSCILAAVREMRRSCSHRSWSFERVIGFTMVSKYIRKKLLLSSRRQCLSACLNEEDFECRSVNFDKTEGVCALSDRDRQSLSTSSAKTSYQRQSQSMLLLRDPGLMHTEDLSTSGVDYFENNCIQEPKRCDFRPIRGLILTTVDNVHENVHTVDECKQRCLDAPYRCYTFDFGADSDPSVGGVCRTSHLNTGATMAVEQPFVEMPGSVTYQLVACLNVSVVCNANSMVAKVKTNKIFNGKIYAQSKPNSCVQDIAGQLDFELTLPYNDLMCDVRHHDRDTFAGDIVIQHHDLIVTQDDVGLSVRCRFNLTSTTVVNTGLTFDGNSDLSIDQDGVIEATTVHSPNVTMRIADLDGNPIEIARVGDQLMLIFAITDMASPYEIFVRDLVAVDGADSSEMVLIDSNGCPTDLAIMSSITKSTTRPPARSLTATFEAFKFPATNIVQFRALITPCLASCTAVQCDWFNSVNQLDHNQELTSYGRRRRQVSSYYYDNQTKRPETEEEVVVVQTIQIQDDFQFGRSASEGRDTASYKRGASTSRDHLESASCSDLIGLIFACCIFLMAQIVLIVAWATLWHKVRHQRALSSFPLKGQPTSGPPSWSFVSQLAHGSPSTGHRQQRRSSFQSFKPNSVYEM